MLCSNILKISLVLPQKDGPQTALKSRSLVEKILFAALGLEARSHLCKRGAKMLTPHNPIEKNDNLTRDTTIIKTIMKICVE